MNEIIELIKQGVDNATAVNNVITPNKNDVEAFNAYKLRFQNASVELKDIAQMRTIAEHLPYGFVYYLTSLYK